MSAKEFLVEPKPTPDLGIPSSTSTVVVRVIDSTSRLRIPRKLILAEHIKGHDQLRCPSYAFLISHSNRHILFDNGVRKDMQNLPPNVVKLIESDEWSLEVDKDVAEILDSNTDSSVNVKSRDIDTVIWSHHHWDHIGDMTTFPKSTELLVGPGVKDAHTGKDDSLITPEYYEGRSFREIDFNNDSNGLTIGGCAAIDFFGDGSFYILDTPGHTAGHISGFARVSTSPDSFILMAGDASHHCGEFRPNEWEPLPTDITPSPIPKIMAHSCPGELLRQIQRNKRADEPYYSPAKGFNTFEDEAVATLRRLETFDATGNVMMIMAHDSSIFDLLPFYPKTINDWHENREHLKQKAKWNFVKDFSEAITEARQA